MKVKVDLRKLEIVEKEIDVLSEQNGVTRQGLPSYDCQNITGKLYFDKVEFNNLVAEEVKNQAFDKGIYYDIDIQFFTKVKAVCNHELTWEVDVFGEPKEDDNENMYFENFEII